MLKLRKILLYNSLYIVIFLISLMFCFIKTKIIKYTSVYNKDEVTFEGIIEKYNIDGDKLSFIIHAKEKIQGSYYFSSLQEKESFTTQFHLGIKIKAQGILNEPLNNTIPNTFNYKEYLYNQKIYYLLNAERIEIISTNKNFFYKIKNIIIKRINSFTKVDDYLLTFILGDKSLVDNEIYTNYQKLGVSHLFAISGMHVSLFAGILLVLLKKAGLFETKRYIITIIFLLFYLFLTSFIPSASRAVLFFSLLSLNKIFYTNIKPINIFLLTISLLIFINPFIIYDIGAQYSIMTSFGLILNAERLGSKNYIIGLIKTSIIAFLFSLPISALNFYEVNFLSIINNLIFVPFITFIIYPLSLLTLIFTFLEPLLYFLINILEALSNLITVKINFLLPASSIIFWIFYYLFLILYLKKNKVFYLFIIFPMLIFNRFKYKFDSNNYIYFLDIGQGDSSLIISPYQKEVIMIDTGGEISYVKESWQKRNKNYQICNNTLIFMKSLGIKKIDLLIITHGDLDHAGEALNIIKNINVKKLMLNKNDNEIETRIRNKSRVVDVYQSKYLKIKNLNDNDYNNENDNSLIFLVKINKYKILYMGDAGVRAEKDIVDKYLLKEIDFLKVGHHGSNTSSSKYFVDKINPKNCIISVGRNNRFNHPQKSVLDILSNCQIHRTDLNGSIKLTINKNAYQIDTYNPWNNN